ncbi:hypothetical protein MASR2M54_24310 [Aliarcobacter cryaerophilus]
MQNKVLVLGSLVLVLLLFIGFSFFYKSEQKVEQVAMTPNINELLLRDYSYKMGDNQKILVLLSF